VTVKRDVTIEYGPWRVASRPDIRVHVFRYPFDRYCGQGWTWCWEINGHASDSAWNLPAARPTWRPVFEEAMTALAARLAKTEVAR
jgi:hypothetical protein